jgi:hypothetical protein
MTDDAKEIIMPWGKFKGSYIHSCPSSYLRYLAENCDWDTRIQEAADEEYQWRERYNEHKE